MHLMTFKLIQFFLILTLQLQVKTYLRVFNLCETIVVPIIIIIKILKSQKQFNPHAIIIIFILLFGHIKSFFFSFFFCRCTHFKENLIIWLNCEKAIISMTFLESPKISWLSVDSLQNLYIKNWDCYFGFDVVPLGCCIVIEWNTECLTVNDITPFLNI